MPYVRLPLPDTKVNAAISMFTEGYLEQAHYLLGVTYPGEGPSNHFGPSAAVMTLLAIAAASRLRIFDPAKNNKRPGTKDDEAFIGCVRQFFPWPDVTIVDDKHRSIDAMRQAAAEELYKFLRNPLVHRAASRARRSYRERLAIGIAPHRYVMCIQDFPPQRMSRRSPSDARNRSRVTH